MELPAAGEAIDCASVRRHATPSGKIGFRLCIELRFFGSADIVMAATHLAAGKVRGRGALGFVEEARRTRSKLSHGATTVPATFPTPPSGAERKSHILSSEPL